MSGSPSTSTSSLRARVADVLPETLAGRPVLAAVGVILVVGIIARFVALGARPTHWDEARVAYWTLYADQQGSFAYRRIIHGPFVQHTSRWLFAVFGTTDFAIRFPVAVVGSLFPASALLFRKHLRDSETVALAALLALNPVILYYSRFMRSDVLVAAFMFTAFGMAVRLYDTRKARYLYGIAGFAALGVASKENSVLYVVTLLGALALVVDRALDSPEANISGTQRLYAGWRRLRDTDIVRSAFVRYFPHVLGAALLFGAIWLFMFAPRGDGLAGIDYPVRTSQTPGFWEALTAPGSWFDLIAATGSQFLEQYGAWGGSTGGLTFSNYQERLGGSLKVLGYVTAPLSVGALLGFARERYGVARGRPLVLLLFFAGAASLVGYPLGLSINTGYKWNVVHVLVPMAIPAAVGLAMLARWVFTAYLEGDRIDRGLVSIIVIVLVAGLAFQGVNTVYMNDTSSNEIVQHGQPAGDFGPLVEDLNAAADAEGMDVLVYANTSANNALVRSGQPTNNFKPRCVNWVQALPLNWYLESTGTNTSCVNSVQGLRYQVDNAQPPIVIVGDTDASVPEEYLEARYVASTYNLRSSEQSVPRATVYVRPDLAEELTA